MLDNFATNDNVKRFILKFQRQGGEIACPLANANLSIVFVQSMILHEHRYVPSRHFESLIRFCQGGSDYAAECANFQDTNLSGPGSGFCQIHYIAQCSHVGSTKSLPVVSVDETYLNLRIGLKDFGDYLVWCCHVTASFSSIPRKSTSRNSRTEKCSLAACILAWAKLCKTS